MIEEKITIGFDSFVFYRSFFEAIEKIPEKDQLMAYKKIMHMALNVDEKENTNDMSDVIFCMAKPQIEANQRRALGGKEGGRPKKEPEDIKNKNHRLLKTKTIGNENKKPNENVNDNKKENKNVNVYSEKFEEFWILYKRKGVKPKAYEYWNKFKLEEKSSEVLKAVALYNKELRDETYRRYAEGFINGLLETYLEKIKQPDQQPQEKRQYRTLEEQWAEEEAEWEESKGLANEN